MMVLVHKIVLKPSGQATPATHFLDCVSALLMIPNELLCSVSQLPALKETSRALCTSSFSCGPCKSDLFSNSSSPSQKLPSFPQPGLVTPVSFLMVILVPPDQHISDAWSITEPWLGVLRISSVSMAWTLVGNGDSGLQSRPMWYACSLGLRSTGLELIRPFWKVISQTLLLIKESGAVLRIQKNSTFQNLTGGVFIYLVNKKLCLHLK